MACLLPVLSIAASACFWMHQVSTLRVACMVGLTGVCGIVSLLVWRNSPIGLLQWDGGRWLWQGFSDTPVQSAHMCLDLQYFVLFQLKSAAGETAWLYLEERNDHARWIALRRAIVAWGRARGGADDVIIGSPDVAT